GAGLMKNAQREVPGHEDARVAQQHVAKGLAESADAGERADSDRDREDDEEEFSGGRSRFAPRDAQRLLESADKASGASAASRAGAVTSLSTRPSRRVIRRSAYVASSAS